jgi:hypothetical protein
VKAPKIRLEAEWEDVEGLVVELAEVGRMPPAAREDRIVEVIADFLDAATPAGALLPPPIGAIAEGLDGAAYRALLTWGRTLFKKDPKKVAARKARRAARRAARNKN